MERMSIAAPGQSREKPGWWATHVETSRVTIQASESQDRVRRGGPTNSRRSLSMVCFRLDFFPITCPGLFLFCPRGVRARNQLGAELLHAAMQIDAHRAVRHAGASRNFRTGHALNEPQN